MLIVKETILFSCAILIIILSISSANAANSDVENLIEKGVNESRQQNFGDALIYFDQAVQIDPGSALGWYDRGLCLKNLGRLEEALDSFDKALQTNDLQKPKANSNKFLAVNTWGNRGDILFDLGRYKEAISSYDEVLNINQRDAGVLNNRGNALLQLGRYDEAISSYNTVINLGSDYSQTARNNRDLALAAQKNGTIPQRQIRTQPSLQPTLLEQPIITTPQPITSEQPTQKAPINYAPIGALVIIIGLFACKRLYN